jgi:hypothetical protein
VAAADDEVRRAVAENRRDDIGPWHETSVPGEWRTTPGLADHAGAVVYSTVVPRTDVGPGDRLFVECRGIFDQADLWFDGAYLGDQEDAFLPGRHEYTDLARLDGPGVLVIEVNGGHRAGPWLPVEIRRTGPVVVDAFRILCRDATESRAHLLFVARLDSSVPAAPVVRTTVAGRVVSERIHRLARGSNTVSWTVDLEAPDLWWPRMLGAARLTDARIEVLLDDELSDAADRRTGIRQVSVDNWNVTVNGERIHAKGAYLDLPEEPRSDGDDSLPVKLAIDIGLDMVRIRRHVAHPDFYDAADEAGLLLWQDVPPRPAGRTRGRRGRRRAERVATGLVDLLGHHPSVAFWHHDFTDGWTHRALVRTDPTRSALGHLSTVVPSRAATDPRVAVLRGALSGVTTDLGASMAVVPNIARFPTVEQWRIMAPATGRSDRVRTHIETLRSVRFRPSSGFVHLKLQDSSILDNEGIHDHSGHARGVAAAVRDACAPVIVAFTTRPGEEDGIGITVVNDTRTTWEGAVVTLSSDGSAVSSWEGTVAADDVTHVADIGIERLRALAGRRCVVELSDGRTGEVIASNVLAPADAADQRIE